MISNYLLKQIKYFLITSVFLTSISWGAKSVAVPLCPDAETLAAELVKADVNGNFVFNGSRKCLKQDEYKHLVIERNNYTWDKPSAPPKPKMVSAQTPYVIKSVRSVEKDIYEVSVIYNIAQGTKTTPTPDTLRFRRFDRPNSTFRCIEYIRPATNFVVKPGCQ